jgi:uncharacterized membrane protein YbhN (UPF0104 family)
MAGPCAGRGGTVKRPTLGKLLAWSLAIAALLFVVSAVPVRDRCWDPRTPTSTRVAVSREPSGCVLHLRTGDVHVDQAQCAALRCEPGVLSTFAQVRPGVFAALLLLYGLGTFVWSARWWVLLAFAGVDLRLGEVWRLSIEAQAGGVLLPGGLGGDAFRIASVVSRPPSPGKAKPPVALVVASLLLDRAVGLAVISGLAAAGGFVWGGIQAGPLPFVLAGLPVGLVIALAALRMLPVDRIPWLKRGRVGSIAQPVLDYLRHPRGPRAIALASLLGMVSALLQIAILRGLIYAVGVQPTAEQWIPLGTAMGFMVAAIPALPGGWGTADAAYVYFFGLAGVPAGSALGVSLLYRLYWYAAAMVGAGLYVSRRRASPASSAIAEAPVYAEDEP